MSLESILSNIRGYCELLSVSSTKEASAVGSFNESAALPTLSKIQGLGKSLLEAKDDKIPLLLEIDQEVRTLDAYCTKTTGQQISAKKAHLQSEKIIQNIDEALFESFLKLDSTEQNKLLEDDAFLKRVENFVSRTDQLLIRDTESGDVLFHQLLRCKSEKARNLALLCLDAGLDINCKNGRGAVGLHLAVQIGDPSLVKELIKRKADQSIKVTTRLLTPLDLALQSREYSCALAFALENPREKINGKSAPEYFIEQMERSGNEIKVDQLLELLELFSREEDINSYADGIWKACRMVTIPWDEDSLDNLEVVFDWLLDHDVHSEGSSEDQLIVIKLLTDRILSRKLSGKNDEILIEKMIEKGYLPLLISDGKQSIPLEMVEQITNGQLTVSARLADRLKELTEKVPLDEYVKLNNHVSKIMDESDLSTQSEIYRTIEETMAELRTKNFPNMVMVENKMKELIGHEINRINEFRSVTLNLSNGVDIEEIIPSVYAYFIEQSVKNDRWDFIAKLSIADSKFSQKTVVNKLIYQLMMDKLLIPDSRGYESFRLPITANALIRALDRVNEMSAETVLQKDLKEIVPVLDQFLTPLLKEFILLDAVKGDYNKFALRVIDKLKGLKPGDSLLVPSGCSGHATSILIEKRDAETFRITHYNTGQGLMKWHYQGKKVNQWQTFDIIDHIPADSILNHRGWESVNELGSSMDPVYECLQNTLGKGGVRVAPSISEEDYETKQSTGSCAMQTLMALLRHQTMQLAQGTPSEREGLYKLFKTQMFTQFHQDNLEQIDETIQRNLSTVTNKLNAQLALTQVSNNLEEYDNALGSISAILKGLGENDLAKTLLNRDKTTSLSRYATLRMASNVLCGVWLSQPEAPPPLDLKERRELQLAFAKFEHQTATIRNITSRLEKLSEVGDFKGLAFELFRTMLATSFTEMGILETVRRLGQEAPPHEGTGELLKLLNGYRVQSELIVQKIKQHLLNEKPELAQWVETRWQELGQASVEKGKTFD